jgi:hypothetical protein
VLLGLSIIYNALLPSIFLNFSCHEFVREVGANGEDFWSYGLAPNRHVLESFLRRHHAEGLSSRLLAPEELLHPSALETHKI